MPVNFDSSKSYSNWDDQGGNISIKQKAGLHKIDRRSDDLHADKVEQSQSTYQEDYIPPPDSPQLGGADAQADKNTPKTVPNPQNSFLHKTQTQIFKLTQQQLANLGQGVTKEQAQAKLIFAFNHPEVPVDPAIKELLNQFTNNAEKATEKQFNLSQGWEPKPSNSKAYDKQVADNSNRNFADLVRSELPKDEANKLIFLHHHPEFASSSDAAKLRQFEGQNYQEMSQMEGFPDGWEIPKDSTQYDGMVDSFNDDAFSKHLNSDPQTKNLTPREKAQLETLHHFPDADVPDKEKLQKFLPGLEEQALQDTAKEFGLPEGFEPGTCAEDYASVLLGEYGSKFEKAVKEHQPPLSSAQKKQLLATGGLDGKNLKPELESLFNMIKAATANEVAEMFGLPGEWLQISDGQGGVDFGNETVFVSDESGETSQTGGTEGAKKKDGVGIDPFPAVLRKQLRQRSLNEAQKLDGVAPIKANRNYSAALNAIQFYQDSSRILDKWTTKLTGLGERSGGGGNQPGVEGLGGTDRRSELGGDWLLVGDFNFAVSKALDKLRRSVYQVQFAEAKASKKTNEMTVDNQSTQRKISEAERKKADEANKAEKKKDILADMEKSPILAPLAKIIKVVVWAIDIILGGAISAICQACGCKPLGENPLLMLGLIDEKQAETMDMALQIIVQVAEIVISICLAQPQLVAALVAKMTEGVGKLAAQVALKTVVKTVVKEAVEAAAKEVAEEAVEQTVKETIKTVAKEVSSKFTSGLSKSQAMKLTKAVEKALEKNAEKLVKTAAKEANKLMKEYGDDAIKEAVKNLDHVNNKVTMASLKHEVRQLTKEMLQEFKDSAVTKLKDVIKNIKDKSLDEVVAAAKEVITTSAEKSMQTFKTNAKAFGKGVKNIGTDIKDSFVGIGNKIRNGTRRGLKLMSRGAENVGWESARKGLSKAAQGVGKHIDTAEQFASNVGKSARKARMAMNVSAQMNRIYQAANMISDITTGSSQIAQGVIEGQKNLKLAQLKRDMGALEASLTELDATLKLLKNLQKNLLETMADMATWINDINKQEGDFFKKAQIHFIAA